METENQQWHDLFSAEKWADILDLHAERVAREKGEYSYHHDLRMAAECIRDLVQQREIDQRHLSRAVRASIESLSKRPS